MTREYVLVVGSLDIDGGHADNTVYPAYVAEARERFLSEATDGDVDDYGTPIVRLEIDFRGELIAGDRFTAAVSVTDVGTTSFTTSIELRTDEGPIAEATTVHVVTDLGTGEAIPVPDPWRERFE